MSRHAGHVSQHTDKRCSTAVRALPCRCHPVWVMRDFASCLTLSVMLAGAAVVSRNSQTHLAFQVSWVLVTLANFVALVLLLVVFLLGGFVRLPGARREIAAVEREQRGRRNAES